MDAGTLTLAISDVCPISGVSVPDGNVRSTWVYVPVGATPAQIAAADNVVATIPIVPLSKVSPGDLIARFVNAEYMALKTQQQTDLAGGVIGNVKNWDTMMGSASIDMNDRRIKAIKNNLVSSGVLTQARADAIFS